MLVFHAGRGGGFTVCHLFQHRGSHGNGADLCLQHFLGYCAGAQQRWGGGSQGDHRGLHSVGAVAAVYDGGNLAVHILLHIFGSCGAGQPAGVGAGGRYRHPCQLQQSVGHRVLRHTHRHRVQSAADYFADFIALGQDHRQRSGEKAVKKFLGFLRHFPHQWGNVCFLCHMHNQRVVAGAALGGVNLCHGGFVQGVGAQSVHRLGGKGHQLPLPQQFPSQRQVLFCCSQLFGFHTLCP